MFDSILVRPNSQRNHPIDFGQIIEHVLFYQKVIVHIGRREIPALYDLAEPDTLETLLRRYNLTIAFDNSEPGIIIFPDGKKQVQVFGVTNLDIEKELYNAAFDYKSDALRSRKFSRKLSRYIQEYKSPKDFSLSFLPELKNQDYLKKVKELVLELRGVSRDNSVNTRFDLEFLDDTTFIIHSDITKLNTNRVDDSSPILALINSLEDIQAISAYNSEISVPDFNSELIKLKTTDVITKSQSSSKEIDVFNHFTYDESWALREAINKKTIHLKAMFKVLDKASKYKEWLQGLEDDSNLMREYLNKVEEKTFLEKLPFKPIRFVLMNAIPILLGQFNPEIGILAGSALTAFDTYLLDKLSAGWKPNQFVEDDLRGLIEEI